MAAEGKANESKENQQKTKTVTDDLFDALNPNKIISNAQRVLSSAVNVLEEEIAAGILAAKKIEKKVIDVDDIRNSPHDLMNRIRRDSHEALDLFLDALTSISNQLGLLSKTISPETENAKESVAEKQKKQDAVVTVIENDEPLKPGQKTVLYFSLADENAKKNSKIQLQKTGFTGPKQQKIHSRHIRIEPASAILKPGEEKKIAIHINLPKTCKPGHYSTLIVDNGNPSVRTVIGIEVV